MNTINRTLLIVIPKKPYIDWVNSFENGESDLDTGAEHYSAYLIPEKFDEFNYKNYLKNHYSDIFEEELYSMIRDSDLFPQNRDYKTYNEWFDTHACTVFDLSNEPLEIEEF
jgi:hypothetical protein